MREPNYADIDGLFCRRGNRGHGGRRRSWRRLSGCERDPPADADGFQAGTQDVAGTNSRLDGTRGAGAAGGCGGPGEARARRRARPGADPATVAIAAAATASATE